MEPEKCSSEGTSDRVQSPEEKLVYAILYNDYDLAETILSGGVDANKSVDLSYDADKARTAHGGEELRGICPHIGDFEGTAVKAAISYCSATLTELLLRFDADIAAASDDFSDVGFILNPARVGRLELVKILYERSQKQEDCEESFYLPQLREAVKYGYLDVVTFFLEHKLDINAQSETGMLPLLVASSIGARTEIVKALLDAGAEINAQETLRGTALQVAVSMGRLEMMELLLRAGADPDLCDVNRNPALHTAAYSGREDIIKLLVDHGADVNIKAPGTRFDNALEGAAIGKNFGALSLLLDLGGEVETDTSRSRDTQTTLLHRVVEHGDIDLVRKLCDHGANVFLDAQDGDGETPLHYAVRYATSGTDVEIAEYLLEEGASPDIPDFVNVSPLQLALKKGLPEFMTLLYSKSNGDLGTTSALHLRQLSPHGAHTNIEIVGGDEPRLIFRDQNLLPELRQTSSRSLGTWNKSDGDAIDFFRLAEGQKRAFIVSDDFDWGGMTHVPGRFFCRWYRFDGSSWTKLIASNTIPDQHVLRARELMQYRLSCRFSIICCALPAKHKDWESLIQLEDHGLKKTHRRLGLLWVMTHSRNDHDFSTNADEKLRSRIYLSSSGYAAVPRYAIDLLPSFLEKIDTIWMMNFIVFQRRLSSLRVDILKARGEDPELIRDLLHDARLLDLLKIHFQKQIADLKTFATLYTDRSSEPIHEMTYKKVKSRMSTFTKSIQDLEKNIEQRLTGMTSSCQDMIQLEFNLTSIAEAQKSTSTNRSIKRLTWVTFIFLPLLYISSLFGMNVDLVKDNPGWWWYVVLAGATTFLTMGVWILLKRSNALEKKLEKRFSFLFPKRKPSHNDLEKASKPD